MTVPALFLWSPRDVKGRHWIPNCSPDNPRFQVTLQCQLTLEEGGTAQPEARNLNLATRGCWGLRNWINERSSCGKLMQIPARDSVRPWDLPAPIQGPSPLQQPSAPALCVT